LLQDRQINIPAAPDRLRRAPLLMDGQKKKRLSCCISRSRRSSASNGRPSHHGSRTFPIRTASKPTALRWRFDLSGKRRHVDRTAMTTRRRYTGWAHTEAPQVREVHRRAGIIADTDQEEKVRCMRPVVKY